MGELLFPELGDVPVKVRRCPVCKEERPNREFHRGSAHCIACERQTDRRCANRMWLEARAHARNSKPPAEVSIDLTWLYEQCAAGVCQVTGRPFDYSRRAWLPVLIRRSPRRGFTPRNCRVVAAIYADCLERWGKEDLGELAGFLSIGQDAPRLPAPRAEPPPF